MNGLCDVALAGGCFEQPTKLEGLLKYRMNILYGPNGTGKSTLGRALANLAREPKDQDKAYSVAFGGNLDAMMAGRRDQVFVFNEDFVDRNVKVDGDEMQSIVMLGEAVNTDEERQKLEKEIEEWTLQLANLKKERDGDPGAGEPGMAEKMDAQKVSIENDMKKSGGFVDRQRDLRGLQRRPTLGLSELLNARRNVEEYDEDITQLAARIQDGIARRAGLRDIPRIAWKYEPVTLVWAEEQVNQLLQKHVKPAVMDEDDLVVAKLAMEHDLLSVTDKLVLGKRLPKCPVCYQSLDNDRLAVLKERVAAIRNEDSEQLKWEVNNLLGHVQKLELELPDSPNGVLDDALNAVKVKLANVNDAIVLIQGRLEDKTRHLHEPTAAVNVGVATLLDELNKALDQLGQKVDAHNALDKNLRELEKMNHWLGYLEQKQKVDEYCAMVARKKQLEIDIPEWGQKISGLEAQKRELEQKMQGAGPALKLINESISRIFMTSDRLRLEMTDKSGQYKLKSRGRDLSPKRVSVGERNILALSYFFASIGHQKSVNERYSTPSLVVIDDPISSFDKGCRAGVIALLKRELTALLKGNTSTKILVMTHDRQTVADLKVIRANALYNPDDNPNDWDIMQMVNVGDEKRLGRYIERGGDYAVMLQNLYDFCHTQDTESLQFNTIGNQIRQVLETFARLVYNKDWGALCENDSTWYFMRFIHMPGDEPVDFRVLTDVLVPAVKTNLLRQMANTVSHAVVGVDVTYYSGHYTTEELQTLARNTLYFMELANHMHMQGFMEYHRYKGLRYEMLEKAKKLAGIN